MNQTALKIEPQAITLRPFEDRDAQAFVGMGKWLQESSHFRHCGFNPAKLLEVFVQLMTHNPMYYGVMAETQDGSVVGVFVGKLDTYFFSDKLLAVDLCFGLLPEYRQSAQDVLSEMFAGYEKWAADAGAVEVTLSTSTGAHGEKLEPFLHSIGYKTVGFTTKKRIS